MEIRKTWITRPGRQSLSEICDVFAQHSLRMG